MIPGRRVRENSRCLLQSVVQDGQGLLDHARIGDSDGSIIISPPAQEMDLPAAASGAGTALSLLEDADTFTVRGEGGLGEVQEGLANGLLGELLVVAQEVDGGRRGPLGALVQEELGQGVGREGGGIRDEELLLLAHDRVFACVHEDPGRGLDLPGAEVDGLAVGDGGRGRETGLVKLGQELGGVIQAEVRGRDVMSWGDGHGVEDGRRVVAEVVEGFREVERGREVQGVGHGVGREEHDVGQLRGEADLADAGDDLVEPGGGLAGRFRRARGVLLVMVVRLVLERLRLDPEPRDARRAGGGREELELERGQGPAAGIKLGYVRGGSWF